MDLGEDVKKKLTELRLMVSVEAESIESQVASSRHILEGKLGIWKFISSKLESLDSDNPELAAFEDEVRKEVEKSMQEHAELIVMRKGKAQGLRRAAELATSLLEEKEEADEE